MRNHPHDDVDDGGGGVKLLNKLGKFLSVIRKCAYARSRQALLKSCVVGTGLFCYV